MFPISDKYGKIRHDFTDEELSQLDETKHEALGVVIAAASKTEIAETNHKTAEASIIEALDALDSAEQAIRDTMPPAPTHFDEVRRMSENSRRAMLGMPPLPSAVFKPEAKLVKAVTKAEAALASAKQRAAQTQVELKAARSVLGDALTEWQKLTAVRTEDMIRDHLARQQEFFRKIAEGEIETREEVEHVPSHLDRSLGSGRNVGGHQAVNYGYGRKHARRGTNVKPKLPSQR